MCIFSCCWWCKKARRTRRCGGATCAAVAPPTSRSLRRSLSPCTNSASDAAEAPPCWTPAHACSRERCVRTPTVHTAVFASPGLHGSRRRCAFQDKKRDACFAVAAPPSRAPPALRPLRHDHEGFPLRRSACLAQSLHARISCNTPFLCCGNFVFSFSTHTHTHTLAPECGSLCPLPFERTRPLSVYVCVCVRVCSYKRGGVRAISYSSSSYESAPTHPLSRGRTNSERIRAHAHRLT